MSGLQGLPAHITVVTVTRNARDALEPTIQSVLAQTYAPLSFLIVDGASTDGSQEIIGKYADQLTCWISEPDRGIYDAMNKGWALTEPDSYVLYLGAGDRLLSLPEFMPLRGGADVYYGHVDLGEGKEFRSAVGWRLRLYNSLHHQALLVRKSCHPDPPFNLHFPLYADFDFNQRLYKSGAAFEFLPALRAAATAGGVTSTLDLAESREVITNNYGKFWSLCAWLAHGLMCRMPILQALRPIKTSP